MATPEDNRLMYVMMALKHAELKIDWNAVAAEAGITIAGNASRKFREIAKTAGFAFTNGKVVDLDGAAVTKATPNKRKSPTKKGKASATATTEHADQEAVDGEASEDAANESPAKKTKTRKTPAKKGKAVKAEIDTDATNGEANKDAASAEANNAATDAEVHKDATNGETKINVAKVEADESQNEVKQEVEVEV
ncbi:hypothetical protein H2200_009374 [Cladophialophora chaetospira]|uniref:Myb-like DNA-binding domain-containing protein n=1 Tax=Cladophialophora chaetospira TaxID=386627 RepID=A0AA39CFB1_9EURO|nr:hypothetical protein H2200_009374 [Cladophialophora chaetospira]